MRFQDAESRRFQNGIASHTCDEVVYDLDFATSEDNGIGLSMCPMTKRKP